ncbi:MAG: aldehyde:ferredoxin oxidoreductase, partial [Planctomycetota bacterium]
ELGTVSNLVTFNRLGVLPTAGFQRTTFAHAERFDPQRLRKQFEHVRTSCAACTIGCEHIFRPKRDMSNGARLEYENLFALGPLCGVDDPETVIRASQLCDHFGLDTISTGVTIAFAMECAQRGWWDAFPVRFGDAAGVLELIPAIARREGVGALLAEGTRRLARRIGPQAERWAPHVKGLELPGYDPRALQSLALGFAVAARGADHNRSGAYQADFSAEVDRFHADERSVRRAIETEDEAALMDSLILCKFIRHALQDRWTDFAAMLAAVTGWDVTAAELRTTARRIVDTKKRYNVWLGWTPAEDRLPERFHCEPVPDGPAAGAVIDRERFAELLRCYYRLRGWSEDGYPPERPAGG